VGIYTRDYYRQGSFGDSIPQVCKWLIIVNVAVFLLQIFVTRPATPDDWVLPVGPRQGRPSGADLATLDVGVLPRAVWRLAKH
jgi:hypothetical protein